MRTVALVFLSVGAGLWIPAGASARLPNKVINASAVSEPTFTISEDVGAAFVFEEPLGGSAPIVVNAIKLHMSLVETESPSTTTQFSVYPFNSTTREAGLNALTVEAQTISGAEVIIDLPLSIFSNSVPSSNIGFILQPLGDGRLTFFGPSRWGAEWIKRLGDPFYLEMEYAPEAKLKESIKDDFEITEQESTTLNRLLALAESTNKTVAETKQETQEIRKDQADWKKNWLIPFLLGLATGLLANFFYDKLKSRASRVGQ